MIIFDTLDNLELYLSVKGELRHVIDIMDRSLPYDQVVGVYKCPENDKVTYKIDAYLSGKGFDSKLEDGKLSLEIVLEGESLSSVDGNSVFVMTPGRFLITSDEHEVRRGLIRNLPVSVKSVVFSY